MRECFDPTVYKKDWQYREGDLTVTRSTQWSAPGCHQGCSILFYTDAEGKLVKVEGDPNSPVTDGRLCMRCLDMLEAVYHPDRIVHPLKRAKEDRGKDTWEQITMDEAYELCIQMVKDTTEKYGAKSICTGAGTGRNATWQSNVLGQGAFGTPNDNCGMLAGNCCYTPRMQGMNAVLGDTFIADCGAAQRGALRPSRVPPSRPLHDLGQQPAARERRRVLRALDHRLHAPRVRTVRGRSAGDVAFGPCQALHPGASRHGRRAGPGHRARDDRRGPLRPRLRRVLVLRLRRVPGARQGMDARARRRDLLVPGREDLRGRAPTSAPPASPRCNGASRSTRPSGQTARRTRPWPCRRSPATSTIPGGFVGINFGYVQSDIRENVSQGASPSSARGASGRRRQLGPHERGRQRRPRHPRSHPRRPCETERALPREDALHVLHAQRSPTWRAQAQAACTTRSAKMVPFVVVCDLFMTPTATGHRRPRSSPWPWAASANGVRGWYTPLARHREGHCRPARPCGDEQMMLELGKKMNPDLFYWDDVPEMLEFVHEQHAPRCPSRSPSNELKEKVTRVPRSSNTTSTRPASCASTGNPGFNTLSRARGVLLQHVQQRAGMDPLPYFNEPPESPVSTPELAAEYPLRA